MKTGRPKKNPIKNPNNRLKEIRANSFSLRGRGKPMSLEEFAELLGWTVGKIFRIENGETDLSVRDAHHVAKRLGIPNVSSILKLEGSSQEDISSKIKSISLEATHQKLYEAYCKLNPKDRRVVNMLLFGEDKAKV